MRALRRAGWRARRRNPGLMGSAWVLRSALPCAWRQALLWAFHCAWASALALAPAHAAESAGLDWQAEEVERIVALGPWPPLPEPDPANAWHERAQAQAFGRRLFVDPRLSASGRVACASCHQPARAFQDGRRTALARQGVGPRNTPGLWDLASQRWFGWGGSSDSLWAASLAPLLAQGEMAQSLSGLAALVRRHPDLAGGWRRAHGLLPTQALPADDARIAVGLAKALAAWQATLVSPRTPFDDFRDAVAAGNWRVAARYPPAAQRGLRLFVGAGRCTACHSGARFTNDEFADIGLPFFLPDGRVDSGRHAGLRLLKGSEFNRQGRFHDGDMGADVRALLTQQLREEPRHFGEFRVPGLRQLVHTAPYWHDGSAARLSDVLHHYSQLDEERLHADGERVLRRLNLSPQQLADLEAFLRSLSAPAPAVHRHVRAALRPHRPMASPSTHTP